MESSVLERTPMLCSAPVNASSQRVCVLSERLTAEQVCRQPDIEVYCFGQPRSSRDHRLLTASQVAQHSQNPDVRISLSGQYALVIYWPKLERCHIYADRFASQRLFFGVANQSDQRSSAQLFIADNLQQLKQQLNKQQIPVSLSQQAMVNYLFFHMIPSPETIYREISCLQPAELVSWNGTALSRQRWWQPRFDQRSQQTEPQLATALLTLLHELVPDYCQQW